VIFTYKNNVYEFRECFQMFMEKRLLHAFQDFELIMSEWSVETI